jgi:hypothetical protein
MLVLCHLGTFYLLILFGLIGGFPDFSSKDFALFKPETDS